MSYYKQNTVATQTFSRYGKQTFKAVGISTSFSTAYSTRQSSSSKAFMRGLPLTNIVKKGGWNTTSAFRKFYNLFILNNWILFSSVNTLFRLYVIKKYDNWDHIASIFFMLSNLNYYIWIIYRAESGNNFRSKLIQWKLIGIIPRFCQAN